MDVAECIGKSDRVDGSGDPPCAFVRLRVVMGHSMDAPAALQPGGLGATLHSKIYDISGGALLERPALANGKQSRRLACGAQDFSVAFGGS